MITFWKRSRPWRVSKRTYFFPVTEKQLCLKGIDPYYNNWEVIVPFLQLRRKTLDRFFEIQNNVDKLTKIRDEYYGGELELIDTWKWGFDGIGSMPLSDQRSEKIGRVQDEETDDVAAPMETEQGDATARDGVDDNGETEDNGEEEEDDGKIYHQCSLGGWGG